MLAPPGTRIAQEEVSLARDGTVYSLKWDGYYNVLSVTGLSSEDAALRFTRCARAGVAWLLLHRGIAADVDFEPQQIRYCPDPVKAGENLARSFGGTFNGPVDTIIQGAQTAIYPTEKRVRVATVFPASLHVTVPAGAALSMLVEGASFPTSDALASDAKLSVALALYGAYFTEHSAKAKFLTLIMSLESLATATVKSTLALELLKKWGAEVDALLARGEVNDDEKTSLDALKRELIFRREDSIRSQIRKLVRTTLAEAPDSESAAREAVRLYDLRSTLVHEGTLEPQQLAEATSTARVLVHRTLLARFEALTGAPAGEV